MTTTMTISTITLGLLLLISATCGQQAGVVQTTLGRVQGLRETVLGKYYDVYWGIPFAKPPLGDLRFKRPEPADPWNGILPAYTKPNSCYQVIDTAFDRFPGVEMWNPNTPMSEDCLYLNIWVPGGSRSHLPKTTMVWIYGGAFTAGASTLDVYNGAKLAVTENVIVASMNYRVGPLGFLYTGTMDAPGNQGLLDQALALKWIYENVVNFGGHQDSITIFGESAGAISVGYHLMSPLSMNYFTRAIMQSGSPTYTEIFLPQSTAISRGHRLSAILNCPQNNIPARVHCLRRASAEDVTSAQWKVPSGRATRPVVDNYFLLEDPWALLAKGVIKDTQILMGVNKDEGMYFLLYSSPTLFPINILGDLTEEELKYLVHDNNKDKRVSEAIMYEYVDRVLPDKRESYRDIADDIRGDSRFICPTVDFTSAFTSLKGSREVYLYLFQHHLSNNPWPDWTGTMHGYEVEAVFGLPKEFNYTQQERDMARRMTGYWSRFAHNGNPNKGRNGVWPKLTLQEASYLKITAEGDSVEQGLRYQQCKFRSTILPLLSQCPPDTCHMSSSSSLSHTILLMIVCFLVGIMKQAWQQTQYN